MPRGPWFLRQVGFIGLAALASGLVACSTTEETRMGSDDDSAYDNSKADGAAYAAHAFTFRKRQKVRSPNNFQFYYKHCELTGNDIYYSKTSYWCPGGP